MQGRENLDRLLALGAELAGRRLELARTREDLFPVLTLRLMRRSGQPLDRAAAWLVAAQRRPDVFLRLAGRALDDEDTVVRSVVLEGVALAALVLERPPGDPTVAALLTRGASDPAADVRKAANESLVLLERFVEAERRAELPPAEALRIALLEQLVPGPSLSQRRPAAPGKGRKAAGGGRRSSRGARSAEDDPTRAALLEEIGPLTTAVAEAATRQGLRGRDLEVLVRAGRANAALASAVGELEAHLRCRRRSGPSAWEAVARAIRDTVPGERIPPR